MPGNEPPTIKSKAEKLAESAYILGCVSIGFGITAIPAIIQAIRALIWIRKEGASKAARRKAVFGIIFPSCVLAFILSAFLSMLHFAIENANALNCNNHLKMLGSGVNLYAGDNGDRFPGTNWCDVLLTNKTEWTTAFYTNRAEIFRCPSAPKDQRCSYALNRKLLGGIDGEVSPNTVMLFESDAGWNAVGGPEIAAFRHFNRSMWVMTADGSTLQVEAKVLNTLRWDPSTNKPAK